MSAWYWFCERLPLEMLHWRFMQNALLAILLMAPLFGLMPLNMQEVKYNIKHRLRYISRPLQAAT